MTNASARTIRHNAPTAGDRRAEPEQLLFLPGASGNTEFWLPVAGLLRKRALSAHQIGWPGFGPTPPEPGICSIHDLAAALLSRLDRPSVVVAQSMGGVPALLAALARPERITHLVLAALSGGVELAPHGARDWRPPREETEPGNPAHLFARCDLDLSAQLPSIRIPTLILAGTEDPLCPPALGRWLAASLPNAWLALIEGGMHGFASSHAEQVASLIDLHLDNPRETGPA